MTTVADLIDTIIDLSKDTEEQKVSKKTLLELINMKYKENVVMLGLLHYKDTLTGDGTSRYDIDTNLTYKPAEIKRIHIDTTEVPRVRALETDVIEGTPAATVAAAEASKIYVWKKVQFTDTTSEQNFITGSGYLTLAALDSGQASLPTFSGDVQVVIGPAYQDRQAYITDPPVVVGGTVQFGVTLSDVGAAGTAYFDILIREMD